MNLDGSIEQVFQPYKKAIVAMEVFPSGSGVVTVCEDRRVTIFNSSGDELEELRPEFPVREVAISPNERYLAICGESRKILLHDRVERRQFVLAGHFARVLMLRFSRSGSRLISAGEDATIRLWETQSWQEVFASEASSGWIVDIDMDNDDSRIFGARVNNSISTW